MLKKIKVSVLAMSMMMISCGDEDDKNDNSGLISFEILQGTWVGACRAIGTAYGQTTYTFKDTTFTYQSTQYTNEACTTIDNTIFGRGSLTLPGDMTTAGGDAVAMVDWNYDAFSWSFIAYPTNAVDWSLICENATVTNNTLDVLGKKCVNGTSTLNFAAESFGALWVNEGKIFVTDINSNGATLETRSTAIDKVNGGLTKLVETEVAE
jgi:hypothetical protein